MCEIEISLADRESDRIKPSLPLPLGLSTRAPSNVNQLMSIIEGKRIPCLAPAIFIGVVDEKFST